MKFYILAIIVILCGLVQISDSELCGYISIKQSFCYVDPFTGTLSNCFRLPFNVNPDPFVYLYNSVLYLSTRNYSDPYTPYLFLAIDINTQSILWYANLSSITTSPSTGMAFYSSSYSTGFFYQSNGGYLYQVTPEKTVSYSTSPPTTQNPTFAFDSTLQRFWGFQGSSMFYFSLPSRSGASPMSTPNIVTMAYNPLLNQFFGLAQAAQSLLLYSWDWNYPSTLHLVGVIPDSTITPFSMSSIDMLAGSLTFVLSGASTRLMTVFLSNASVIATTNSLLYNLQSFTYENKKE